jgi:phage FluMu gp28-like protein
MTNLVILALEGMFKWQLDHLEVTINVINYLFHHQVTIFLAGHLPMESHITYSNIGHSKKLSDNPTSCRNC